MPFEPNAMPVFQIKKRARWEERLRAACRAHVRHSRVAHAADHSLRERERCESNSLMLWPPPDLRPLRYYYCDVSGPYPILEPSAELYPARISLCFEEEKKISLPAANSLSSELSERVDPPIPFVLATYPKVSSPRAPRRRQRKQPVCCGGAAFFFHNKTWTIIPTFGSLRPLPEFAQVCPHPPNLLDEESFLANKHNPYTHLGAPPPAYPYKTRVGGSRSYEVPTTRSTLPKGKRCVCQVRFFLVGLGGFDQKCYAYTQDYPSSRKLRGDYFRTTDDRP
ncbi:hypothetical protein KY290_035004 [Solanum tuberosum]|uniref:Uncharacterized protein n=1 Tax=Solanum tuberosum TaxID=4113 RepID=A0ABQ7U6I4_SOLTU|nr:hypothetical protein KY284_037354 [Solanum tuberosum]KAH0637715.1 hypothetical protein KY289_037630 [Solanum tuberosum]KAH0663767.1 hypothetical protein KY284_028698 [Solanum tuberosum]KAH0741961.1 hypothetical protein KY290_035004 [Solanum tuberosum]